jgi:hypothetical protein
MLIGSRHPLHYLIGRFNLSELSFRVSLCNDLALALDDDEQTIWLLSFFY